MVVLVVRSWTSTSQTSTTNWDVSFSPSQNLDSTEISCETIPTSGAPWWWSCSIQLFHYTDNFG